MNLPLKIAYRYFKGKKSAQAINIVTWISISAIALSATAMVVLFSVYNGLENYVKSMYTSFYPNAKIVPVKGKFFTLDQNRKAALQKVKGVKTIGFSTEDMALLDGSDHQKVISLKGVDNNWFAVNEMERHMNTGAASWPDSSLDIPSNIGVDIIAEMGIDVSNPFHKISIFYPRADAQINIMNPDGALSVLEVAPYASFSVQPELDGTYFLVPIAAAQKLFNVPDKISAVEIAIQPNADEDKTIAELQNIMGTDYKVMSRFEQNKTLYMVTRAEKWAIYGILLLVLIIASFNMVGSLSMLALDKKLDIAILKSMGTSRKKIRAIFLNVGIIISAFGAIVGMLIGLVILLLQLRFGFIAMGDGFMDAYPVALKWKDFLLVFATVLVVGLLAALYPAWKAAHQPMVIREE